MATKPTTRIPDWGSTGTRTDPGAGKEATGWIVSERPPAFWWNWLLGTIGDWLTYFDASIGDGYQISSALDSEKSVDVSAVTTTCRSVTFAGSKMYVCSLTDAYQYYLAEPYNPSGALYESKTFDLGTDTSSDILHECIRVNAAGTRMYTLGGTNDNIYQWTLSTPYDITSASYDGALSLTAQDTGPLKFDVSQDGTKIFMFGQVNNSVFRYSMTAWDITTASFDTGQEMSTSLADVEVRGIAISSDGVTLSLAGDTSTESVYQYEFGVPYDITTGAKTGRVFDMTGFTTSPIGMSFSPSGRRMYIVEDTNDVVHMWYTAHIVAPEG